MTAQGVLLFIITMTIAAFVLSMLRSTDGSSRNHR